MTKNTLLYALLFGILATGMATVIAVMYLREYLQTPLSITEPVLIEVKQGSSLRQLATHLHNQNILELPDALVLWARYQGVAGSIKTGEYELLPGVTPVSLLEQLVAGRNKQYPLSLIEGWTFRQALEGIWSSEKIDVTLQELDDAAIAELLGNEFSFLEGSIFPDTYFYTAGTSDLAILRRARQRLTGILEQEWAGRLGSLPYQTPAEALILASIIEKESGLQSEKQRIAGVFVRRLEMGMRLQSDPTVIYGMGSQYTGNIRRSDLNEVTPYNTYRINGLPPSPIALSGRPSIYASLNPEEGSYLYFVASGDGGHYFSHTLDEHNAAVQRYLRNTAAQPSPQARDNNN